MSRPPDCETDGANDLGLRVKVVGDGLECGDAEVDVLCGDPRKAREKLGWRHETSVRELAREMVREDLKAMAVETVIKGA